MNTNQVQTGYIGSTEISQIRQGTQLVAAPRGDSLWYKANALPSLDLKFATNKSLTDSVSNTNKITFTRASSGTYVDSQGVIRTATTNLLTRSEEFDSVAWTPSNAATPTANAVVAPNGTLTADKLITTNAVTGGQVFQTFTLLASTTYTFSVFAKASEWSWCKLTTRGPEGSDIGAWFNLSNGTVGTVESGVTASIQSLGDGWYRCIVTRTTGGGATAGRQRIYSTNGDNALTTGDGISGIYIWGAQLEQSSTVGEYIPTTSTINSAPRFDHNPTTGESLGLLVEEQRTNLSQQSDNFSDAYWTKTDCTITSNESTAPDGTLTADLWTNTASPGTIQNNITKDTTIRTYTASVWIKGTMSQFTVTIDNGGPVNRGRVQYNLSTNTVSSVFNEGAFTNTSGTLTPYPNGWVRLTLTTTTSTGTTIRFRPFFSGTGSTVRIWGAQVEEGAFATSYIPTTTATVTRSADVASITGSNFSSWYRQDEGSIYFESKTNQGASAYPYSLFGSSTFNRIYATYLSSARIQSGNRVASTFDPALNTLDNSAPIGFYGKGATSYKIGDFAFVWNGNNALTGSPSALADVLKLDIGNNGALSGNFLNGTIRRLTYWPQRLNNSTLQKITQ